MNLDTQSSDNPEEDYRDSGRSLQSLFLKTNDQKIKETAYNTYVRPQIEYCTPVWHSWQKTLQRASVRYVLKDYSTTGSVTEMLIALNWQSIEHRRIQNSLMMLYKIKYHLFFILYTYC